MQLETSLRPVDLAFLAAKKRQSPRTGFVHFFYGNETASDTIPFYENLCYAVSMLYQKKSEAVLEAKDLILRLLAFQTPEGNFPVYLHDYPKCYSLLQGLKVAPLLLRIVSEESSMSSVGTECKEKIGASLNNIFTFYEKQRALRPLNALWEHRYQICNAVWKGEALPLSDLDTSEFSATDWWEYWVSEQFRETPRCSFYHPDLEMCIGDFLFDRAQDGPEPAKMLIDWICGQGASPDHPAQMGLAALDGVEVVSMAVASPYTLLSAPEKGQWNLLWKNGAVHSLFLESLDVTMRLCEPNRLILDLPAQFELHRDDLFELAFFVNADPQTTVLIGQQKGTTFQFGEWIEIQSGERSISLRFNLAEGEGDFCGHIYRSNRSNQKRTSSEEAFDWKIGLRTLRRSEKCAIIVDVLTS